MIVEVGVWSMKNDAFREDVQNINALVVEIDALAKGNGRGLVMRWVPNKLLNRSLQIRCVDIECEVALSAMWRDAATHCVTCHASIAPQKPWHDECRRCWGLWGTGRHPSELAMSK